MVELGKRVGEAHERLELRSSERCRYSGEPRRLGEKGAPCGCRRCEGRAQRVLKVQSLCGREQDERRTARRRRGGTHRGSTREEIKTALSPPSPFPRLFAPSSTPPPHSSPTSFPSGGCRPPPPCSFPRGVAVF
eukprot:scaffold248563_cov28-Tisochrysis_lutea.AAC.2